MSALRGFVLLLFLFCLLYSTRARHTRVHVCILYAGWEGQLSDDVTIRARHYGIGRKDVRAESGVGKCVCVMR